MGSLGGTALLAMLFMSIVFTARTTAIQVCTPPVQKLVLKASSTDQNVDGRYATIFKSGSYKYLKFTESSSSTASSFTISPEGYLQGTSSGITLFANRGNLQDIRYVSMATQEYIETIGNAVTYIKCTQDSTGVLSCASVYNAQSFGLLQSCGGSDKGYLELGNRIGNGCWADSVTLIDVTPPNTCTSSLPTSTTAAALSTNTVATTTSSSSPSCTSGGLPPTPTYIFKGESDDTSINGNYAAVLQDANAGFYYIFFKTNSNTASSFVLNSDGSLQSGVLFAERNYGSQLVDYIGLATAANMHYYTQASCLIDGLGYLQCNAKGTIFQACPNDAANNDYAKGYLQIGSVVKTNCKTVALKAINIAVDPCTSVLPSTSTTAASIGSTTSSTITNTSASTSSPNTITTTSIAPSTTNTSSRGSSTIGNATANGVQSSSSSSASLSPAYHNSTSFSLHSPSSTTSPTSGGKIPGGAASISSILNSIGGVPSKIGEYPAATSTSLVQGHPPAAVNSVENFENSISQSSASQIIATVGSSSAGTNRPAVVSTTSVPSASNTNVIVVVNSGAQDRIGKVLMGVLGIGLLVVLI